MEHQASLFYRKGTTFEAGRPPALFASFSPAANARLLPSSVSRKTGTAVSVRSKSDMQSSDWFPFPSSPHSHIPRTCSSQMLLLWPLSVAHVLQTEIVAVGRPLFCSRLVLAFVGLPTSEGSHDAPLLPR